MDEYIKKLKKFGYTHAALTDFNFMHGTIKFYQMCISNDIKPIIGLKILYEAKNVKSYLLLYAINNYGYTNLMKISTILALNECIDYGELCKYTIGILAIIPYFEHISKIPGNNMQVSLLASAFSELYVGYNVTNELELDEMRKSIPYFEQHGIIPCALNKVVFLNKEDQNVFRTVNEIRLQKNVSSIVLENEKCYLVDPIELQNRFLDASLIENSYEICQKCNVLIDFNKRIIPSYNKNIDPYKYLYDLSFIGLKKRMKTIHVSDPQIYYDRLLYELQVINKMKFCDYFLIVFDYVSYAKKSNIYVGPGRGSAGASLVSFALGITDVDPIRFNLLFERFLNIERISMPDIDIDFPDDERDKVIKYVGKKYGKEVVAHIVTFGTYKAKMAIKDAAKVLRLNEVRLNQILLHINKLESKGYLQSTVDDIITNSPELTDLINEYEDIREVCDVASKLYGLIRNTSTHAAGIVMTEYGLINYTPLEKGLNDIYMTQYEACDLEKLGLLKMDVRIVR